MIDSKPGIPDRELTLRSVLGRLEYLVSRGRRRTDPDGCLFCCMKAAGPLCDECAALLERLAARFPKKIGGPSAAWVPSVTIGGDE